MKTLASITAALALAFNVQAEIITLTAFSDWNFPPDATKNTTASIDITADQTIELLSTVPAHGTTRPQIEIRIGEALVGYAQDPPIAVAMPLVVRGPAKLTLIPARASGHSMATFRITPERVDPTKTVIVYPGTNNAVQVTLLCSTNLTDWFPATNGIYSGLVAKFFRIGLERLE